MSAMSDANELFVLDTSAWLTLIEDEPGAELVQQILERARRREVLVLVSFMTFMEVRYITLQERDQAEADARIGLMASLPILRVESSERLSLLASDLKANHRLSVADAWIAALAKDRNATLVHKDPEFEQLGAQILTLQLPYKPSA